MATHGSELSYAYEVAKTITKPGIYFTGGVYLCKPDPQHHHHRQETLRLRISLEQVCKRYRGH